MKNFSRLMLSCALSIFASFSLATSASSSPQCGQELQPPGGGFGFGFSLGLEGDTLISVDGLKNLHFYKWLGGSYSYLTEVSNPTAGSSKFGEYLAIDDYVVVGDERAANGAPNTGAIYIYDRQGVQQGSALLASDHATIASGANFGSYVATYGDSILVAARQRSTPGAYLFEASSPGVFTETRIISPANLGGASGFGFRVALNDEWAVVSDPNVVGTTGQVHAFRRSDWAEFILVASDGVLGDGFGSDLALNGDRLMVSAAGKRSIYEFTFVAGNWVETQQLAAPFVIGGKVAFEANEMLTASDESAVRFVHDGNSWVYQGQILPPVAQVSSGFGANVALSGGRYAISADLYNGANGIGVVFVEPGQEIGTPYCGAVANSTGQPAELKLVGSDVVALNNVATCVSGLPTGSFGYFVVSQTQGFIANPGGSQGNLCIVGAIGRGNNAIYYSSMAGMVFGQSNLTALPQPNAFVAAQPGDNWNFQYWYRDGTSSNFSNAVSVTLQ